MSGRVLAPTVRSAACCYGAGMAVPNANGREGESSGNRDRDSACSYRDTIAEFAIGSITPAIGGARGRETTRVEASGANNGEGDLSRDRYGFGPQNVRPVTELAQAVFAPTVGRASRGQPAGKLPPRTDVGEDKSAQNGLGDGSLTDDAASKLAINVVPPTVSDSGGSDAAAVRVPGGNRGE